MTKTSRSLFESREAWEVDPENAFLSFVVDPKFLEMGRRVPRLDAKNPADQQIRASSVKIYQQMFRRFLRFLKQQNKTVFTVSHTDIMDFLNAGRGQDVRPGEKDVYKPLTSTIRIRYLRLLERVFQYLKREPNPARHASLDAFQAKFAGDRKAVGVDEPTVVLSDSEQEQFMAALPAPKQDLDRKMGRPQVPWLIARDRAMLSMLLGAGLTVSEVLGVELDAIGEPEADGSLPITILPEYSAGTSREHVALLRPFAVAEISDWLRIRKDLQLPIPSKLLFPTPQGKRMDKTGLYKIVKATFERAGLEKPRMGGRTLRNTYAVREVLENDSLEVVNELLGHRIMKSTELVEKVARVHRRSKPVST